MTFVSARSRLFDVAVLQYLHVMGVSYGSQHVLVITRSSWNTTWQLAGRKNRPEGKGEGNLLPARTHAVMVPKKKKREGQRKEVIPWRGSLFLFFWTGAGARAHTHTGVSSGLRSAVIRFLIYN